AVSLRGYRRLLDVYGRAALTMLALVDLTLLLASLQRWQLSQLRGTSTFLLILPAAAGVLLLISAAMQAGRDRVRAAGSSQSSGRAVASGRDDDLFWKAGLFYINRND